MYAAANLSKTASSPKNLNFLKKKNQFHVQCNFRPYTCPYAGSECSIVGDIPFLVSHLRDDHKVDMHNGSTFNHRYVKSNPHEVEKLLMLQYCFTILIYYILGFLSVYQWQSRSFGVYCLRVTSVAKEKAIVMVNCYQRLSFCSLNRFCGQQSLT